jgi:hypothetical protein
VTIPVVKERLGCSLRSEFQMSRSLPAHTRQTTGLGGTADGLSKGRRSLSSAQQPLLDMLPGGDVVHECWWSGMKREIGNQET